MIKKITVTGFLLSVAFSVVQGSDQPSGENVPIDVFNCWEQPELSDEIRFFPVPGDCIHFYACAVEENIATKYTCDEGLNFSPTVQACTFPDDLTEPCYNA